MGGPTQLEPVLRDRLTAVGLDPDAFGDPDAAWRALHARFGRRITLVERYALEAVLRGIAVDDLPLAVRSELGRSLLAVRFPDFALVEGSESTRDDPIVLAPYDPSWPGQFDTWRHGLADALGETARRIEHVGSTAVPGLVAKPVIDIQLSVPDVAAEDAYVPAIEGLGVALRSREAVRRYFRPSGDRPRIVQIHVCVVGSEWERDHLLFRDYLRTDADARRDYETVKHEAAARFVDDRLAYTDVKTGVILDLLEQAELWAAQTGWRVGGSDRI
jgi:GrpB-like predicted nucleotidyltransferase (UPF0157 family)